MLPCDLDSLEGAKLVLNTSPTNSTSSTVDPRHISFYSGDGSSPVSRTLSFADEEGYSSEATSDMSLGIDLDLEGEEVLMGHQSSDETGLSYGGNFAWVDAHYKMKIASGLAPLQWMNALTKRLLVLNDISLASDGTFTNPLDDSLLFPRKGIDLRWRFDSEKDCVIIDFFKDGKKLKWRWDELRAKPEMAFPSTAPDFAAVGHAGKYSFRYELRSAVGVMGSFVNARSSDETILCDLDPILTDGVASDLISCLNQKPKQSSLEGQGVLLNTPSPSIEALHRFGDCSGCSLVDNSISPLHDDSANTNARLVDFVDLDLEDEEALMGHQSSDETSLSYGGNFAWVDAHYKMKIASGLAPLQWMNALTKRLLVLNDIALASDGTFINPLDDSLLFPRKGIDLRWRFDSEKDCIIIDFFKDGKKLKWRWDELRAKPDTGIVADFAGIGHAGKYSFRYELLSASRMSAQVEKPSEKSRRLTLPTRLPSRMGMPSLPWSRKRRTL